MLGTLGIHLEEINLDVAFRHDSINGSCFDPDLALNLGLPRLEPAEAFRGQIRLEKRAETAMLEQVKGALAFSAVQSRLEDLEHIFVQLAAQALRLHRIGLEH